MFQERSAGIVIFRRSRGKPMYLLLHYGWGHWGFPKGNIECGETERTAALREAEEETGIHSIRLVDNFRERIEYFYRKKGTTIHKEVIYFLAETEEREVHLSYEHKRYKWLFLDDALKQLSYTNDQEVLEKAHRVIQRIAFDPPPASSQKRTIQPRNDYYPE